MFPIVYIGTFNIEDALTSVRMCFLLNINLNRVLNAREAAIHVRSNCK